MWKTNGLRDEGQTVELWSPSLHWLIFTVIHFATCLAASIFVFHPLFPLLLYFSYLSFHLMVSTTVQDLAKGGFKWSFQSCNRSIVCNTPLPLDSALLSQVYLGNKRGGREIWQARGAGHVKGVRLIFYFFPFGCISAGWWTALLEEVGGAVEAVTAQLKFSQECHCTIHGF